MVYYKIMLAVVSGDNVCFGLEGAPLSYKDVKRMDIFLWTKTFRVHKIISSTRVYFKRILGVTGEKVTVTSLVLGSLMGFYLLWPMDL